MQINGVEGSLTVKTIQSGQNRAYEDSLYKYRIESSFPAASVKEYCLTQLHPCKNSCQERNQFQGHCGFPFGLDTFYYFREESAGVFEYWVCSPFCD